MAVWYGGWWYGMVYGMVWWYGMVVVPYHTIWYHTNHIKYMYEECNPM